MKETTRVCWLCRERDLPEHMEREEQEGKRNRFAHLSCKEEAALLYGEFVTYEMGES